MSGPVVPSKRPLPNQVRPTLLIHPATTPSQTVGRRSISCLLGHFSRCQVCVDFLTQFEGASPGLGEPLRRHPTFEGLTERLGKRIIVQGGQKQVSVGSGESARPFLGEELIEAEHALRYHVALLG